jgi:hypothetical protein
MVNEEYEKYNKMQWVLMLFQISIIVLSAIILFLNWQHFEVPCLR